MKMAIVEYMEAADLRERCPTTENNKSPFTITTSKRSRMETDVNGSSNCHIIDQEELLKSTKAKMGEVREENERLKKLLAQFMKDYKSLEKKISSMVPSKHKEDDDDDNNKEPEELISLTLGSWISDQKYDDNNKKQTSDGGFSKRRKQVDGRLELGLDCKFENYSTDSMKNSTVDSGVKEELKEEENIKEKEKRSSREGDEEESLNQPQVKKTRVSIRSRCDTSTINDGCQWRKYGQKIAKGNPCPRAYYRCTVSPTCPVRKQVQRCSQDMSILITTYEGTHNHPLPLSATAMASATSAAAAMLKAGSLTSQPLPMGPTNHLTATSPYGLHNSNLITTFNNNNPRLISMPNPSMISTSSHSHPTITLDLTTPNSSLNPFNWLSSSTSSINPSGFLNFSSSPSNALPTSNNNTTWGNNGCLNYGTLFPYKNNNNTRNTNIYQNPSSSTLNETIAAVATKAIASNPNFQSVLAAAISSYVGNKSSDDNKKSMFSSSNSLPEATNGSLKLFPTSLSKNNPSGSADTRDHIS